MATVRVFELFLIIVLSMSLSACAVVGDIFKAGALIGALSVIAVIALVVFIGAKLLR